MCAAIDMLSSEHNMFYGRSPPAGFLTDYTPPPFRRQAVFSTRGFSAPCLLNKPAQVQLHLKPAPRSCLKIPTEKTKKRVVFADDRGLALEQVKFMTEPSHLPPFWALTVVSSPPQERKPPPKTAEDVWEIKFVQPASDYVEFRRRITQECVSLENVIIKQSECAIDGTVKVKNLDFLKEVFVRTTSDGWRTHEDTYCAFIETGPLGKDGASAYDTFGFRIQLPLNSRRLEMCVCFKCKGNEFWDNNKGMNYIVEKSSVKKAPKEYPYARIKSGNSWSARTDVNGSTPYW